MRLSGTYECKADAKGRFMLPADLRKLLMPVLSDGFVFKRSIFQPCLELYPAEEWEKELAKLDSLNQFKKKNNDFIRLFTAGVRAVEVDNNSRLLVPKELKKFSGISKELTLSATVNKVEVWDTGKYEEFISEGLENLAELTEEVMGNESGQDIS